MKLTTFILFIILLAGCRTSYEIGMKHIEYTVDSTFTKNDTVIRREYKTNANKLERQTLWLGLTLLIVYIGLLFIKK